TATLRETFFGFDGGTIGPEVSPDILFFPKVAFADKSSGLATSGGTDNRHRLIGDFHGRKLLLLGQCPLLLECVSTQHEHMHLAEDAGVTVS
ncbi:hypothetical protein NDU88_001909, partial [Pleurodeles waltl]